MQNDAKIILSPNPAKDKISIHQINNKAITQIIIYNSIGKEVKAYTYFHSISETIMDVSTLESGLYMIVVTDDKGFSNTGKFVKL